MSNAKPTKAELFRCICLTCMYEGDALFWLHENGVSYQTAKCPKCSNRAINMGLVGISEFMRQIAKRIKTLENDMFDIQAASDPE